MLNIGPPKPPKIGTSRWFKGRRDVLDPNDPALHDDYNHDYGDENPSHCLPPTNEFSILPPRSTSMNNLEPLPRSLLPSQPRAADEPPSGPSKMDIPHCPAGKELPLQPAQQPQKQSGLQPPPPPPAELLSSILSAYSRIPGESLVSSSDGASTNSNRQSEANISSIYDPLLPNTKTNTLIGSASTKLYQHQHRDQQ
ncbi:hypothetical protein BHE90_016285 [Fusarium euwallaceae]|uniref:Uncharacterized protein n=3 Tax=Fusarium solani species complex TaxID=232080 RepID=A0A3M2R1F4_9HYPO|nr:hypothetical protein CDV36_016081 [Fusarium kuroshium]RSL47955.1 hypothetical protein CEP51_015705 [Fusarium floridanum]RTE69336.1 hypothetical protein BHE90_016285 [Fusarium euwallaceae]